MNAWAIADAVLNLVAVKFERDAILARVRERELAGDTPEQIVADLKQMRDQAIAEAEKKIEDAGG